MLNTKDTEFPDLETERINPDVTKFMDIDATVEKDNVRWINLMKKLGFKNELELKDNLIYFYLNQQDIKS